MDDTITIRKIGLTGGIACGKSTVAELLRQHEILVIDLDAIGRQMLSSNPLVIKKVGQLLGSTAVSEGKVDRQKVREIIFADAAKREKLEALLHPRIRNEFEKQAQLAFEHGHRIVVCEAALLIEGGYYNQLDELIVVFSRKENRIERLIDRDKISTELAQQMIDAQTDDRTRRKLATIEIENDSTEQALALQVETLVDEWKTRGWI